MSDTYEVGTRAWQPDPNEGWVASEVEQKLVEGDKVRLIFRLENGEVRTLASNPYVHSAAPMRFAQCYLINNAPEMLPFALRLGQ